MSFFEPPPPPDEEPESEDFKQPEWFGPGSNVLGTPIPLRLVLARTDDVAVAITHAHAFPTGLQFTLAIRRRSARESFDDPLELHSRHYAPRHGEPLPPELLRVGLEFADGRKATTTDQSGFFHEPGREPERPVLMPGGGGGGGGSWDMNMWLWPLPPPGPLAFVCEWPSEGVELTRVEIDAGVVIEAADQAEVLWEDGDGPSASGGSWVDY